MARYIRIETVDTVNNKSMGGYFCALTSLVLRKLDLPPETEFTTEIVSKMQNADDPDMTELLSVLLMAGDIPKPDIYINNPNNHICLYTESEFCEVMYFLLDLDELVRKDNDRLSIKCKDFFLDDNEIVYSDDYQVVITKETYDEHINEFDYFSVAETIEEIEDIFEYEFEDFHEEEEI